jgi:hypothetical protein
MGQEQRPKGLASGLLSGQSPLDVVCVDCTPKTFEEHVQPTVFHLYQKQGFLEVSLNEIHLRVLDAVQPGLDTRFQARTRDVFGV